MTRFQRVALLIGGLIVVLLLALVVLTALRPAPANTPTLSVTDRTNAWLTEFAPTQNAVQTGIAQTLTALTPTPSS